MRAEGAKLIGALCEWDEFARIQARRIGGGDPIIDVYFVGLGGHEQYGIISAFEAQGSHFGSTLAKPEIALKLVGGEKRR